MKRLLTFLFFLKIISLKGQETYLQIIDNVTKESVPFATILTNFNYNTISNEEGFFHIIKSSKI